MAIDSAGAVVAAIVPAVVDASNESLRRGLGSPHFRAAATEPFVCQLLREQLVEVITRIRSQTAMGHGRVLEDMDE
ncbi:hypothetical protein ACFYO2_24790 [Streptomyces sp. NPDC006602]|uniref:hypothetical protein n=1 Tax=Streptomyces sp. NPDC006602 TaxID=3364751 RepID=UPI0036ADE15E